MRQVSAVSAVSAATLYCTGLAWHRWPHEWKRPPQQGVRTARNIAKALQANGIAAVRVPLSGAVGGRFAGDIVLPLMGRDLYVEVKARAAGFRELYSSLDGRDVLIVKADRQEPLAVLRMSLAVEIAKRATGWR
jgi:Holliday junction resolvase